MNRTWFKKWGWIHRPSSGPGWLLVIVTALFCFQVFVAIDRNSNSASDTFYGTFPFIIPALLLLDWIASKTSSD